MLGALCWARCTVQTVAISTSTSGGEEPGWCVRFQNRRRAGSARLHGRTPAGMDRRRFQAEVASPAASPPPQENVALLNRARDAISRLQADLADAQRRAATAEHALGEARTHAELAERRADGLEFSLQETRSELQGLYDSQQHQLAEVGASTASLRGRLAGLDGEMRERAAAAGSLVAERNALQEQVRLLRQACRLARRSSLPRVPRQLHAANHQCSRLAAEADRARADAEAARADLDAARGTESDTQVRRGCSAPAVEAPDATRYRQPYRNEALQTLPAPLPSPKSCLG